MQVKGIVLGVVRIVKVRMNSFCSPRQSRRVSNGCFQTLTILNRWRISEGRHPRHRIDPQDGCAASVVIRPLHQIQAEGLTIGERP